MSKPDQGNDRAAALAALDDDQRKRLEAFAYIISQGAGDEPGDLFNAAVVRWLSSDKPIEGPEQTEQFLKGAMNSIRSNKFRRDRVVRRYLGERALPQEGEDEDPVEQAADPTASTEGPLVFEQLFDLCGDDEDVQHLVLKQWDMASPAEIQSELGWDEKRYATVLKRKRRMVIRLKLEGKLP